MTEQDKKYLEKEFEAGAKIFMDLHNRVEKLEEIVFAEPQKLVNVDQRVSLKTADKNNYEEIWDELKTWTKNIGEWVHKENFITAMKQAEVKGWNDCYKTYIEDNSIEP